MLRCGPCGPQRFFLCLAGDQVEDLLGKGDHDAACNGEHTIGALGGIVALEGQTHLQNAEAQQDEANGADQRENKLTQIVDYSTTFPFVS